MVECCQYVGTGFGEELLPMTSYPDHHSTVEKDFLGVTIPASTNADPNGDLKLALDTLFNHPNLPPFFCRQLIEHLVTSNPSPAYVNRVAQVFIDDGTGTRGNMQAVITAILSDTEARTTASAVANPQYGKVREALLRYTEWARAFTAQSRNGGYWLGSTEDPIYGLGEMTLRSPTVFKLVRSGIRSAWYEHCGRRAGGTGISDDQCDDGCRLSELHAGCNRRRRDEWPGCVRVVRHGTRSCFDTDCTG